MASYGDEVVNAMADEVAGRAKPKAYLLMTVLAQERLARGYRSVDRRTVCKAGGFVGSVSLRADLLSGATRRRENAYRRKSSHVRRNR